jgi:hypothetical protein
MPLPHPLYKLPPWPLPESPSQPEKPRRRTLTLAERRRCRSAVSPPRRRREAIQELLKKVRSILKPRICVQEPRSVNATSGVEVPPPPGARRRRASSRLLVALDVFAVVPSFSPVASLRRPSLLAPDRACSLEPAAVSRAAAGRLPPLAACLRPGPSDLDPRDQIWGRLSI